MLDMNNRQTYAKRNNLGNPAQTKLEFVPTKAVQEYGISGNESNWKRFQLGGRWIPGWPRARHQGNHFSHVQEHFYQIRLPAFTGFVRTYLGGGQNQEWGRYLRQPAKLECVELSEKKAASKSREPRLTYMTWQL